MFKRNRTKLFEKVVNLIGEMTGLDFNRNKSLLINTLLDIDDINSVEKNIKELEKRIGATASEEYLELHDLESLYNKYCLENRDKYNERLHGLTDEKLKHVSLEVMYETVSLIRTLSFEFNNYYKRGSSSIDYGNLLVNIISKLSDDVHNIPLCHSRDSFGNRNETLMNEITSFLHTVSFFEIELKRAGLFPFVNRLNKSIISIEGLLNEEQ